MAWRAGSRAFSGWSNARHDGVQWPARGGLPDKQQGRWSRTFADQLGTERVRPAIRLQSAYELGPQGPQRAGLRALQELEFQLAQFCRHDLPYRRNLRIPRAGPRPAAKMDLWPGDPAGRCG